MKIGSCGTLESNDALITICENEKLDIVIDSIVGLYFYDDIKRVIEETLSACGLTKVLVKCVDKGALNYTLKARLLTAIQRMEDENA